jgi:hypothetical protein
MEVTIYPKKLPYPGLKVEVHPETHVNEAFRDAVDNGDIPDQEYVGWFIENPSDRRFYEDWLYDIDLNNDVSVKQVMEVWVSMSLGDLARADMKDEMYTDIQYAADREVEMGGADYLEVDWSNYDDEDKVQQAARKIKDGWYDEMSELEHQFGRKLHESEVPRPPLNDLLSKGQQEAIKRIHSAMTQYNLPSDTVGDFENLFKDILEPAPSAV